jgi:hypothetical protein
MLDGVSGRLRRAARARYLIPLFAAILAFDVAVFPLAASRIDAQSQGASPLDLRFGYSPDTAYALMRAYGAEGRRAYLWTELTADLLYPVAYALFLGICLAYVLERVRPASTLARRAPLIPFAALVADYAENVGIIVLLARYPERSDTVARVASAITGVKWVFFASAVALLAVGLGTLVVVRGRDRRRARDASPRPS